MASSVHAALSTSCPSTSCRLAPALPLPHAISPAVPLPPSHHPKTPTRLDGYSFIFPEGWLAVTSSGNDIFLRNPANVDQNLFVDISSPSSSRWGRAATGALVVCFCIDCTWTLTAVQCMFDVVVDACMLASACS